MSIGTIDMLQCYFYRGREIVSPFRLANVGLYLYRGEALEVYFSEELNSIKTPVIQVYRKVPRDKMVFT